MAGLLRREGSSRASFEVESKEGEKVKLSSEFEPSFKRGRRRRKNAHLAKWEVI